MELATKKQERDADKIYLLLLLKDSEALKKQGVEIQVADYDKYDMKSLQEFVKAKDLLEEAKTHEKLSDLISGEGIEVDFEEELSQEELPEGEEEVFEDEGKEESYDEKGDSIELFPNEDEFDNSKEDETYEKVEPLVDSSKKRNFIIVDCKNENGEDVKAVLEVDVGEKGIENIKFVGQIKGDDFIPSEDFKEEIMSKVEQTGVTQMIDTKIIEREFVPSTPEQLFEMNENGKLDLDDTKDIANRAIEANKKETYPDIELDEEEKGIKDRTDNDEVELDEKEPEKKDELSGEDKSIAEKACKTTQRSMSTLKRVLTIRDPKSVTDTLDNDGLNERGEKITVLEFRSATGKEEYVLVQGNRILDRRPFDSDIYKLVKPIRKTEGEVLKVSDEETKVSFQEADGKTEEVKVQAMPSDLNQSQKAEMIQKVERIAAELKALVNTNVKEFASPEDKYLEIDRKEQELYNVFVEYRIVPPPSVEYYAEDITEPEQVGDEGIKKEDDAKTPWDDYMDGRIFPDYDSNDDD